MGKSQSVTGPNLFCVKKSYLFHAHTLHHFKNNEQKKIPLIFLFFVVTCFQVQLVRKVLQKWVVLISLGSGLSQWEMSGLKKVILGHENFGLSVCWGGFLQEEEAIRLLKVSHSPLSTHHVYKAWEKKDQNRMSRKTKPWPTPWSVGA